MMQTESMAQGSQTHRAPEAPVRRVGTVTMGLALVLGGAVLAASYWVPAINLELAAKLCPLLLVALGVEVLVASASKTKAKLRYDIMSMFLCFFLLCGSMGIGLVYQYLRYQQAYGTAEQVGLEQQAMEILVKELPQDSLKECKVNVWASTPLDGTQPTLEKAADVTVDAVGLAPVNSARELAQLAQQIKPALEQIHTRRLFLKAEGLDEQGREVMYSLDCNSQVELGLSLEGLTQKVQVGYWQDGGWYSQQELESMAQEEQQEQAAQQEQARNEGYEEGFRQGYEQATAENADAP